MRRPPKALIFTTINWAATAQLALALISKGFEVASIAPREHGIHTVSGIKAHFRSVSYTATPSFVASVIELWSPNIVIPCDDLATFCLHDLYHKAIRGEGRQPSTIKALIENSLGDPESYPIAQKKSEFIAFAGREGLSVPETIAINNPADLALQLETSGFPQVLKLDKTSSGLGVRIVNDQDEAKRAYHDLVTMFGWFRATKRALKQLSVEPFVRQWRDESPTITLQRYVAGVPANRSVLCWKGEVLAGLSVEAIRTAHATGPATVIRTLDHAEMEQTARHVIRRLGLSGFVGFDFILETASGRAFLIEMNPRPTPICHFSFDAETDMAGALFMKLTDGRPRESGLRSAGKVIALFPGEFWRDPNSEYLLAGYNDEPLTEPRLISAYARPLSPHSLSWISNLCFQFLDALLPGRVPG
jgi:glutathione synthase/RimK-type ligase-like ATP-grasp enzyme